MPNIPVPPATKTDYSRKNFAIECACKELLTVAVTQGIRLKNVVNLMYLPDQELTRNFQKACRDILEALAENPSDETGETIQ